MLHYEGILILPLLLLCDVIQCNIVKDLYLLILLYDVVQCNIIKDLVAIVPGIQCSVSGIVVEHGQVAIFIGQRNVDVLVGRGVGGVGIVHLGSSRVSISDIQSSTDHEGLTGTTFWVVGGPATDDLQSVWV